MICSFPVVSGKSVMPGRNDFRVYFYLLIICKRPVYVPLKNSIDSHAYCIITLLEIV